MRICSAVLTVTLLVLAGNSARAQDSKDDGSAPIVFHVTSVKRDGPPDICTTGKCYAYRFSVEGYSKVPGDAHFTDFELTCTEYHPFDPAPDAQKFACPRLRANGSYDAKLFADVISFEVKGSGVPNQVLFEIVSQREVVVPKRW
jgi:hypothetical protein